MKVKFNFNLSTWMRYVEIEADSYEKALEELYTKSLSELLEMGMEDETTISDVEGEILERTIKVKTYDFEWDIEEDDYSPEEYNELLHKLPVEMTFEVTVEPMDDETELIADEIYYQAGYPVTAFRHMIIEEK